MANLYSIQKFITQMQADRFRTDQPVDTSRTWLMLDGLAHMVDESGCYRVNYCRPVYNPFYDVYPISPLVIFFNTQIVEEGWYPNYELRVATTSFNFGDPQTLRASIIVPSRHRVVTRVEKGVVGTVSVSSPVSAGWNLEARFTNTDANRCPYEMVLPEYRNGDGYKNPFATLCCVIDFPVLIDTDSGFDETFAQIVGVQIREYPR